MIKFLLFAILLMSVLMANAVVDDTPVFVNGGTIAISSLPATSGTMQIATGSNVIGSISNTSFGVTGVVTTNGTQSIAGSVNVNGTMALSANASTASNQTLELATLGSLATSANQTTANSSLSSIDGKITAVNTGAVVVASSALPSGASTSAKQDTLLATVGSISASAVSIDTKLSSQATAAKQDTTNANLGTIANAVVNGTLATTILSKTAYYSLNQTAGTTGTLDINTDGYEKLGLHIASSPLAGTLSGEVFWYGSMDGTTFDNLFSCANITNNDGEPNFDTNSEGALLGLFNMSCNIGTFKKVRIINQATGSGINVTIGTAIQPTVIDQVNGIVFTQDIDWRVSAGANGNSPTAANSKPIIPASDSPNFPVQVNGGTLAISGTSSVSVTNVVTVAGTIQAAGTQVVVGTMGIIGGTIGVSGPVSTFGTLNIKPFVTTISGTGAALNADIIASTDVSNYSAVAFNITNASAANNVQVQFGIGTFTAGVCYNAENSGTTSSKVTTIIAPGNYVCQVSGKNMRIRITAYSSSTLSLDGYLSSIPFAPISIDTKTFITGGTTTVQLQAANGDNLNAFSNALQVYSTGGTYNTQSTGGTIGVINTITNQVSALVSQNTNPWVSTSTVGTLTALGSITNALPAGTSRLGSVRLVDSADADLTSAKSAQTSRFVGVQSVTDSGRTAVNYYFNAAAAGGTGTETMITLTKSFGTTATSTGTTFVVTSGKTFRIQDTWFGSRGNVTATAQISTCSIRMSKGIVGASSTPVLLAAATATPATALAWDRTINLTGADGYEIYGDGTIQFGVSCNAVYTTNAPTWYGQISGYEY